MRVLFAWEVGRNYGHVTQLTAVARPLSKKRDKNKAELFFALQNPAAIRGFADDFDYKLLQAPYYPVRPEGPKPGGRPRGPSLIYADDLRPCGYDHPKELAGLIQAWRDMYELVEPDVLVVQAAPTALLAARGLKFKKVAFGGSYDIPPLTTPMQPLRYWEKIDEATLKDHEEYVLGNVNEALEELKLPKLRNFSEMLETDAEFLTMLEELDHYPERPQIKGVKTVYHGPFFKTDSGENVSWKKDAEKKILGYIRPGQPSFLACLEVLAQLPTSHDIIVSAPGIPADLKKKVEKPNLRIIDGPARLDKLLKSADLGICHASLGISCAFVLSGVPLMLFPTHIEQLMFARAVGRNKAGRGLVGNVGPAHVKGLIDTLLGDESFKKAAQDLARKYKDHKPAELAAKIADDIVKLTG